MQESDQTPNWQPISFLPSIAEMIDGMLESAQEVHVSLQQAHTQPHVMDDYTRAWRCWGLGHDRYLFGLNVQVRIPAFEDAGQFPVQRPHARLQQQMHPSLDQAICCFLQNRLLTTSFTVDSHVQGAWESLTGILSSFGSAR